ncbi:hypothetical protein BDQ17DRAFT_1406032 [Cyathus striatus]|nr:hypothetical protein BDQ17DRAFT_1406032 [Cyathus striatus]
MSSSFIDPTSLSFHSPSPAPSTPGADHPHPTSEAGPSRKRARTELSSEERKEARAHRNRIAAQNSRDRRKAQFSHLERRVQELEEENRQLRAGMRILTPTTPVVQPQQPVLAHVVMNNLKAEDEERLKQQRENEELRERIKTLEKGWEAVASAPTSTSEPTIQPTSTISTSSASTKPTTKLTTINTLNAFPSPAPSHSSLDFDLDNLASGPNSPISLLGTGQVPESTRHLARVATIDSLSMPQQRVNSVRSLESTPLVSLSINSFPRRRQGNGRLSHEILVAPPTSPSASSKGLSIDQTGSASSPQVASLSNVVGEEPSKEDSQKTLFIQGEFGINVLALENSEVGASIDWANEIMMQSFLDSMLVDAGANGVQPELSQLNEGGDISLEMGWELASGAGTDVF